METILMLQAAITEVPLTQVDGVFLPAAAPVDMLRRRAFSLRVALHVTHRQLVQRRAIARA